MFVWNDLQFAELFLILIKDHQVRGAKACYRYFLYKLKPLKM